MAALLPARQALADQQDVVDEKRADRDATLATIKELGVRLPRVLDGALEPGDPMHGDVDDIRSIEAVGLDTIIARGQRVLSDQCPQCGGGAGRGDHGGGSFRCARRVACEDAGGGGYALGVE